MINFEPGAVIWHRHRGQFGVFFAVHDLEPTTGVVDFGRDERRVSLNQLDLILGRREADAWRDTFQAVRVAGLPLLSWEHDLRERYREAVSFLAGQAGLLAEWRQRVDGPGWDFNTVDLHREGLIDGK